jgi:hypothetical protein
VVYNVPIAKLIRSIELPSLASMLFTFWLDAKGFEEYIVRAYLLSIVAFRVAWNRVRTGFINGEVR